MLGEVDKRHLNGGGGPCSQGGRGHHAAAREEGKAVMFPEGFFSSSFLFVFAVGN